MADTLILNFDGACEPTNPGGLGTWGFYIQEDAHGMKGRFVHADKGSLGQSPSMTNNVAEYTALGKGLRWLFDAGKKGRLLVRGDSKLVICQVTGEWNCNAAHLVALRDRCRELLAGFEWKAQWVPREENEPADRLTRQAWEDITGKAFPSRPTKRRRVRGMRHMDTGRGEG